MAENLAEEIVSEVIDEEESKPRDIVGALQGKKDSQKYKFMNQVKILHYFYHYFLVSSSDAELHCPGYFEVAEHGRLGQHSASFQSMEGSCKEWTTVEMDL